MSPNGMALVLGTRTKECSTHFIPTMICENCGKEHDGSYGSGRFCCASCRVSFTNKQRGKHSEETKQKISKSVFHGKKESTLLKLQTIEICPICDKQYHSYRELLNGSIKHYKTCSNECRRKSLSISSANARKQEIQNGTFSGWKSRNIISYPEKFWIEVLNNNHIDFIKEYHLDNKYFLDFYIVKNKICIDLEIDGKQHKYEDRLIHDKIRDEYVSSKNILVYRIDWNEIKSTDGSLIMKEKIDSFLNWYNNL